jgi:hypothetical protein
MEEKTMSDKIREQSEHKRQVQMQVDVHNLKGGILELFHGMISIHTLKDILRDPAKYQAIVDSVQEWNRDVYARGREWMPNPKHAGSMQKPASGSKKVEHRFKPVKKPASGSKKVEHRFKPVKKPKTGTKIAMVLRFIAAARSAVTNVQIGKALKLPPELVSKLLYTLHQRGSVTRKLIKNRNGNGPKYRYRAAA